MSIALSPFTFYQYTKVTKELRQAKASLKESLKIQLLAIFPAFLIALTCLVLSILASVGVLATPHTLAWRFGIGFSAYLGLCPISGGIYMLFFVGTYKNFQQVKKIDAIIRKKNLIKSDATTYTSQLPKEILELIFSYLNYKDINHASRVCKGWSIVANSKCLDGKFHKLLEEKFINRLPPHIAEKVCTEERQTFSSAYRIKYEKEKILYLAHQIDSLPALEDCVHLKKAIELYFEEEVFISQESDIEAVFT